MGLDTLDEFSPRDTDPVSLGDDAIRATRAATKQTVGVEHYLDGPHKIPYGTVALRPAAGRIGRLYINTDSHRLEYDNGSAWISIVDQKAQSTILWHTTPMQVVNGSGIELPFDNVLSDPGGYANATYHQIIMPANSVCLVTVHLAWDGIFGGGLGVGTQIEQHDGTNWQVLVTEFWFTVVPVHATILTAMADSRWGANLRVTCSNGSPAYMYVKSTPLGASPRFAMTVLGRST